MHYSVFANTAHRILTISEIRKCNLRYNLQNPDMGIPMSALIQQVNHEKHADRTCFIGRRIPAGALDKEFRPG